MTRCKKTKKKLFYKLKILHPKQFELWPPAAGDDSHFRAVWRRGAEVTGGPPLLLASAAHVEDIPEMKWQGLIGRGQIWRTSVVVEQRSADKKRNKETHITNI